VAVGGGASSNYPKLCPLFLCFLPPFLGFETLFLRFTFLQTPIHEDKAKIAFWDNETQTFYFPCHFKRFGMGTSGSCSSRKP